MDAGAYLRKQGWKGSGHPLDRHGRGIKKPLLIAHKQDQLGLGKKKAAHNTDDQWWMRAFDESLKNIGSGQESTLSQVRSKGVNRGGLYGFFVKGEGLAGTISTTEESSATEASDSSAIPTRATTPVTSATDSEYPSERPDEREATPELSAMEMNKKESAKKRKRDGSQAETNVKRKKAEQAAAEAEDQTQQEPTAKEVSYDIQAQKTKSVLRRIDREVNPLAKTNTTDGEYGAITEKQVSAKKARYQRERAMRDAKKDLKKQLVVDAMMRGDLPNPKNYTREEALVNYEEDQKENKQQEKRSRRERKQLKEESADAIKLERERQKETKRLAKKEVRSAAKRQLQENVQGEASATMTIRNLVAAKLDKLSAAEKAKYEERASTKNQNIEEYILRRIQKKAEKKARTNTTSDGEDEQSGAPEMLFFMDVEGDADLPNKVNMAAAPVWTPLEDGSCPQDPAIWEGRSVKSLPKPVREARRLWLAEKRLKKKIAAGKIQPDAQPHETRLQHKMMNLQKLTGKLLADDGIVSGATKTQIKLARRRAQRIMKEEKKEKKRDGKMAKLATKKSGRHRAGERAKAKNMAAT